ncbi:hypothetical protein BLOT_000766 [Blomia tropicalis]|nr:hypothetical protein BLOT_000766 [Blomia tropicalis]
MANTFATIVSGRLVQTDFQQVETSKFLITIPEADNINHLVVFLTGLIPLPDGTAGAVYFSFPDPLAPPTWFYLGYISNQKPSAIFKITKLKQMATNGAMISSGGMGFSYSQPIISHVAQIGISIEPLNNVFQLTSDPSVNAESGNASQLSKFEEFINKAAENMFNYCSSFANTALYFARNPSTSSQQFVPLATINEWYQRYMRNLKQNPNFWRM